jgi:hypothetical protein
VPHGGKKPRNIGPRWNLPIDPPDSERGTLPEAAETAEARRQTEVSSAASVSSALRQIGATTFR